MVGTGVGFFVGTGVEVGTGVAVDVGTGVVVGSGVATSVGVVVAVVSGVAVSGGSGVISSRELVTVDAVGLFAGCAHATTPRQRKQISAGRIRPVKKYLCFFIKGISVSLVLISSIAYHIAGKHNKT